MSAPPTQQQIINNLNELIHPGADIEPWTTALIGEQLMLAQQYNYNVNFDQLVGKTPMSKDEYYYKSSYACQRDAEKVNEGVRKAGLK